MGLRPRLSAAAFAARFEPRAGARETISLRIVVGEKWLAAFSTRLEKTAGAGGGLKETWIGRIDRIAVLHPPTM